MIREATMKLIGRNDLSYEEAAAVMNEIMSGEASGMQTAAFLAALETKGETIDEITACASVMRERAEPVKTSGDTLEIVGTGGDGAKTFNISTTAAFVIAAGGVKVAKHGNRAASSASGAADCLEALGVNISLDSETCARLLDKIGICFLFAQKYHLSMKYVGPVRRELGVRTVFNILGPLTNPAHPTRQVWSRSRMCWRGLAFGGAWRSTAPTGWMRFRFPRRPLSANLKTAISAPIGLHRRTSAFPRVKNPSLWEARRRRMRRLRGRCSRASAAYTAMWCCSTPARDFISAAPPVPCARASRLRRSSSTAGLRNASSMS